MNRNFDVSGWFFKKVEIFRIVSNVFFFNYLIHVFFFIKGVRLGRGIKFNGYPIIYREPDSRISIGDNCRFNSSRNSVAIKLTKRCRFITLRRDAEIIIGNNSGATGVTIAATSKIKIGDNVLIGAYSTIIDSDFHNADPNRREIYDFTGRPVIIEDNVFLGMNCVILKGVTIGKNSVIGANSVVFNNIPPDSIAIGNPCKLIMKRNWGNSGEA